MAEPLAAAATKMLEKVWGAAALTCHSAEGNLMSLVCQVWDMALEKQIMSPELEEPPQKRRL